MKGCKGWTNIDRPSCKKITAQSTSVTGSAAGGRNVIVYAQRSGKSIRLGYTAVNKKKQFTVKIKKQKKNTVLKIVSKDKYSELQIVFMNDDKVVCYLYGDINDMDISINFDKSSYKDGVIEIYPNKNDEFKVEKGEEEYQTYLTYISK